MGFLKELSRYMVKYGELAINKTEILAKLAKLKIEIKKREMEIEKVKIEIGEYVISQFEKKEQISDDVIMFKIDNMNSFKQGIDELRLNLETVKTELWETKTENQEGKKSA
jgi:hypothetical protein